VDRAGWTTKAFFSYDPYEDQRIDPLDGDRERYPEVPFYLHSAINRAKKLVNYTPINDLLQEISLVNRIADMAAFYYEIRERDANGKILYSGRSGALKDYLLASNHYSKMTFSYQEDSFSLSDAIPIEKWPRMFGVLALSLAGDIVNELWPTEEYLSLSPRFDNGINDFPGPIIVGVPDNSPVPAILEQERFIQDCGTDAVQAVGFGEGMLFESQYRKEKQNAAKKPSKVHQRLYEAFNTWALGVSLNHGFRTTEDAVNLGFMQHLREQDGGSDLLKTIGDTTHRRLKKNLEKHCRENNKLFPFPRLRSKK